MYGCVLLVTALWGYRSFLGIPALGWSDVTWAGVIVLLLASATAAATVRPWGDRIPAPALSAAVWGMAALALVGSSMALLNLIELRL
uniref:hypothetical protein n=1 Tax=Herbidospora sakaeratensis TaxID=564415 RepID=UPI000781BD2A|nr:hypothetical protein [Herbidospora sakaeratensis]